MSFSQISEDLSCCPDEMGFRATSANLNLNRDYMKADAPETRAWLSL